MNSLDAVLLPRHREVGLSFEEDVDVFLCLKGVRVVGPFEARYMTFNALRALADRKLNELTSGISFEKELKK